MLNLKTQFIHAKPYLEAETNASQIFRLFEKSNNKKNIRINFRESVNHIPSHSRATHSIHKYPGKLILQIPRFFLNNDIFSSPNNLVVDPFCGTGTVLLESIMHERNSLGIEINPVSALISKVKTTPLDILELKFSSNQLFSEISKKTLCPTPEFHNIDYWFSKKNKQTLAIIYSAIKNVKFNQDIEDFFLVCFSSIIRKSSKADPHISQPVISKKMRSIKNSINVKKLFENEVYNNMKKMSNFISLKSDNVSAQIIQGDSKVIKMKKKIELIITSPPYINAQEYLRSTKLEYYWLGFGKSSDLCNLKKHTLGLEGFVGSYLDIPDIGILEIDRCINKISKLSKNKAYLIAKYYTDFRKILKQLNPQMITQGFMILIIGNNTISGKKIMSNKFLSKIAQDEGYVLRTTLVDEIKKYNENPLRNSSSNTIKEEYVLILQKES